MVSNRIDYRVARLSGITSEPGVQGGYEMSYRRLTEQEIEDLRNEMKRAGQWVKEELKRRKQSKDSDLQEPSSPADPKPLREKP